MYTGHEPAKPVHKKHNTRRYEHPSSGVAGSIGVGRSGLSLLTWKRNSAKFAVARWRSSIPTSGIRVGLSRDSNPISQVIAEFVARNRGKRAQVVAFQLPENFRTSLSYATGFATVSVRPPERLGHRSGALPYPAAPGRSSTVSGDS
jgi:hypothetical protein